MSRTGNCWDKAVSESSFATLKKELVNRLDFATRTEAYDSISDYIDNYYNGQRGHSVNDCESPSTRNFKPRWSRPESTLNLCPENPGSSLVDVKDLTASLLAGLVELEQSGDLVIIDPIPLTLAEHLCAKVMRDWGLEHLDEPIELAVELGLKQSTTYIEKSFALGADEARAAVEKFLRYLESNRTPKEVAELICHQGYQEVALGAFFCSHLQRGEYYGMDYLDWRKAHYDESKRR